MEAGLIAVIIWTMMLVIGVAAAVKKAKRKAEAQDGQPAPKQPDIWEEIQRRMQQEAQRQAPQSATKPAQNQTSTAGKGKKVRVAAEGSLENAYDTPATEPSRTAAPAAPAADAGKPLDLDFDPEQMVIYSEIMKPGYEKY